MYFSLGRTVDSDSWSWKDSGGARPQGRALLVFHTGRVGTVEVVRQISESLDRPFHLITGGTVGKTTLRLLALLTAGGVMAPVQAQSFGIKGGLTFATLSESDLSPNFKNQTGFAAGIHLGLGGGGFVIQPEALLTQVGAGVEGTTADGELQLSYLQIPVNLRFNIGAGGLTPFILGGPYAAFKLSCDVEDLLGDCDDLDLGSTDYGVDVGGGLKFGGGLFIEARYNFGLKDISDVTEGFDVKQRAFMVLAGFEF